MLVIPPRETKGRQPHEAEIAEPLRSRLQRYLKRHRPVLLRGRSPGTVATDTLWVSAKGTPMSEETIYRRVAKATARSGISIGPHLFRSCAGTTIAIRAPKAVGFTPAVLDHGNPETSERFYNMAGSLEASRAQSAVLEQLMRQLNKPARSRGKKE